MSRDNKGRWKTGTSGNPGGRPSDKRLRETIQELLDSENKNGGSNMDLLVGRVFQLAIKGNMSAVKWLADRSEGRTREFIEQHIFQKDELIIE